ncbi:LysR family transcriptional regulator [Lachnospiraceae bacterium]|nr:LysR family transcriptional regulator [Lachnospiraceae bacterium]
MNTFQLTCFVTVSQTLNFARAAEELNITQPAVTHQIHSLESELDTKLFRRTTRTVELTTDGFLFLDDAKKMLAISDRAKARLINHEQHDEQIFSIGSYNYAALLLLPDILRSMRADYPNIHPRLQIVPPSISNRLLDEDQIDVFLGFQDIVNPKFNGVYKELQKVPILCICLKDHPLAKQKSVHINDLRQEILLLESPFIGPSNLSELRSSILKERTASDFRICDSPEAAAILVKAGYGIAIQTGLSIPTDDSLTCIPVEGLPMLSVGAYYKTLKGNPMLKRFLELLKQQLCKK